MVGRALTVSLAVALTAPCAAGAWSLGQDLSLAASLLPAGHPCRAGVPVRWVPGLVGADGGIAEATAPQGVLVDGRWMARATDGGLLPMPCDELRVDPANWDVLPACERRRLVLHEVWGHMGGHEHSEGGLMSQSEQVRDRVAVPGCRAVRVGVLDRAADRVLGLVPVGWEVSCGWARRGVIGCSASRGRAERRYRVRVRGSRLLVRRVAR